jgi:hypothetical protein
MYYLSYQKIFDIAEADFESKYIVRNSAKYKLKEKKI